MTDMNRAGLLEIIAGKTRSNTAAAILSNTEDLQNAYQDAMVAEGSALKENEKYLDSIQGRLDLFTNAVQTMWSDALNSDAVKFFIDIGTEIVKVVDKLGLIPSLLTAIATGISVIKNQGFFKVSTNQNGKSGLSFAGVDFARFGEIKKNIVEYNALATASSKKQAEFLSGIWKTDQGFVKYANSVRAGNASMGGYITSLIGAKINTIGLTIASTALNAALTMGLSFAIQLIVSGLQKLFGWIKNSIFVTQSLDEELEKLQGDISGLNSEINSLKSELKTCRDRMAELTAMPSLSFTEQEELRNLQLQNIELERQIELNKILAESKQKQAISTSKERIQNTFSGESSGKEDYAIDSRGVISHDNFWTNGKSAYEVLDVAISKYEEQRKLTANYADIYKRVIDERNKSGQISDKTLIDLYKVIEPSYANYSDEDLLAEARWEDEDQIIKDFEVKKRTEQDTLDEMYNGINMVLNDMQVFISENGLSYTLGDDEINTFLDKFAQYQYLFQEAQGVSTKSSAIESMFDDTQNEATKNIEKRLQEITVSDQYANTEEGNAQRIKDATTIVQNALDDTSPAYDRLRESMKTMGRTAEEVASYFVQKGTGPDATTVEGITEQYEKGVEALEKFKNAGTITYENLDGEKETIGFDNLFEFDKDSQKWKAIDTQISKVLVEANKTARQEFAHLIETVKNEGMSLEDAMNSFRLSGVQAGLDLIEQTVIDINTSMFKDLDDDLSGLIDTFGESRR